MISTLHVAQISKVKLNTLSGVFFFYISYWSFPNKNLYNILLRLFAYLDATLTNWVRRNYTRKELSLAVCSIRCQLFFSYKVENNSLFSYIKRLSRDIQYGLQPPWGRILSSLDQAWGNEAGGYKSDLAVIEAALCPFSPFGNACECIPTQMDTTKVIIHL